MKQLVYMKEGPIEELHRRPTRLIMYACHTAYRMQPAHSHTVAFRPHTVIEPEVYRIKKSPPSAAQYGRYVPL